MILQAPYLSLKKLDGLVLDGVMHIGKSRQQAPDEVLKNTLANLLWNTLLYLAADSRRRRRP
jgi:hypothetical protein